MARQVLTDASPLIGLARVNGVIWLEALFGKVWMPLEVHSEVMRGTGLADEQAIGNGLEAGYLQLWPEKSPVLPELPDLGKGEAACIRIGLSFNEPGLILMDDRAGRSVAREHGLFIAGTAAIIGMAKKYGLIPSAKEVFDRLLASDFRISSSVINVVLQGIGEV